MSEIRVGMAAPSGALVGNVEQRQRLVAAIAEAGLDHVGCSDHVSFHGGTGFDGLIRAAQLASLHDELPVVVAVYLLPLRHPTPVARQISGIAEAAPGRLASVLWGRVAPGSRLWWYFPSPRDGLQ